jgi:hypothetical protein
MLAFEFGGQCTAGHPNGDYYYGFKRQSYYKFIMDKTGIEKREKYSYHEFVHYHTVYTTSPCSLVYYI